MTIKHKLTKPKNLVNKFVDFSNKNRVVVFVIGFAVVGSVALLATHAAGPTISLESENGTVTCPAIQGNDASASGGKYVQFKNNSCDSVGGTDTSCQFSKADPGYQVAFCDGFNSPSPKVGNRSGDLLTSLWGVSRVNSYFSVPSQGKFGFWFDTHNQSCGPNPAASPDDVRICNGKLVDSVNDNGTVSDTQTVLAMYPKQPFDIAGRTGTAVFDVGDDTQGPHAAWPEWWYTDQPIPAPHGHEAGIALYPRNGVGLRLTLQCNGTGANSGSSGDPTGFIGVERVTVVTNYQPQAYGQNGGGLTQDGCVTKGSSTALNHFEVRISSTSISVWGSDAGSSTVRELTHINVAVPLTRGVTWMEDAHYNACKLIGTLQLTQCDHQFVWDNFGFDGPKLSRDGAFDAPDGTTRGSFDSGAGTQLGYGMTSSNNYIATVHVPNVSQQQTPSGAIVTFTWYPCEKFIPSVSVNGNPYITPPAWPYADTPQDASGAQDGGYMAHTIALPVPSLSQIHTDGSDNVLQFKGESTSICGGSVVANVDLILLGAFPPPQ